MSDPAGTELRDPLHGPIPVGWGELRLIDTAPFQRLRRIKQLGFAEFAFPGAVHTRYLHSIGAMHLAGRLFDALAATTPVLSGDEGPRLRQTVRLAALFHDIGHPPLSHAAEALLPSRRDLAVPGREDQDGRASHEDLTLKLVLDSELARALDETFGPLGVRPRHVAGLIDETLPLGDGAFDVDGLDLRPLLHAMVSGELDVDRMDYLLRDSFFAGVSYGGYDLDWLMSNALAVQDGSAVRLGIDLRALPAFEHFLLARYHMFQMVYFHPKSDAYDAMLRRWLAAVGDEARFPADPEAYVACDDAWLMARLRASRDPWARRVVEQRPFAMAAELREPLAEPARAAIDDALAAAGIEPLWLKARPVLSRYARSPAHLRTDPLLVRDGHRPDGAPRFRRIEDVTDLFGRYERTLLLERLYVERDHRARARALVAAHT